MISVEEYIDILTRDRKPTGKTALKSQIHKEGHYHNTAHVWFYTDDGKILLAQRAASKTLYPLLWDVSVAGHIDAGETVKEGAIREVMEEIGLKINENDLEKIGVFDCFQKYDSGIIDYEFHHTFIIKLTVSITNLTPQEGEVEDLKLVSIDDFSDIIDRCGENLHLVESNKSYYEFVKDAIVKKIS